MSKKKNKNGNKYANTNAQREYTDQDIERMELEAAIVSEMNQELNDFLANYHKLIEVNPQLAHYIGLTNLSSMFEALRGYTITERNRYNLDDII